MGRSLRSVTSSRIAPFSSAQGEEPPMTQTRQHPALHNLDGHFDLGLVARPPHPGWQHRCAVMAGHVLVGSADPRLVATGCSHTGLEIVADDLPRDAAKAGERANMAANPVRQRLRPAGLGIGEVGGAERCHKDLRVPHFAPSHHRSPRPSARHKSTNSRSPAGWFWRIVGDRRPRQVA